MDRDAEPELLLISTWPWDPHDPVAPYLRRGTRLHSDFVEGAVSHEAAVARAHWHSHLERPEEGEFRAFLRSMRFRLGYAATDELLDWTKERMELVGLKHDDDAVRKGHEQIWQWIADGKGLITPEDMNAAIDELELRDAPAEPAVSLYIHTILKEPAESDGDYELEWPDHFEGDEWLRGHRVHDQRAWNEVMLPELRKTRERIVTDTTCRLLRARGAARLSAWLALGHVFPDVGGWTLEVDQIGRRWRSDAEPADDISLVEQVEAHSGDADTLAVGISITGDLSGDLKQYLAAAGEPAGTLLLLGINRPQDRSAIRSAGDLTKLAQLVRARIRDVLGHRPQRVLLFYFGPLSGAALIGHQLNAIAGEIQLYEDQAPGYAPSFLLR